MHALILLFGFWHFSPAANEYQFQTFGPHQVLQTCGAVGASSDGMYVADAMASGGAADSISVEFNTLDGAKAFIERECGAR